jgi:hypothetical protein
LMNQSKQLYVSSLIPTVYREAVWRPWLFHAPAPGWETDDFAAARFFGAPSLSPAHPLLSLLMLKRIWKGISASKRPWTGSE